MVRIMKKTALFLFLLWLATACENNTPGSSTSVAPDSTGTTNALQTEPPPPAAAQRSTTVQTIRGMYKSGNEVSTLYDCATGKTYRVTDQTGTLDSLYREACQFLPYDYESVYAVVAGRAGPRGTLGYAAEYDGTLDVIRIDTLTPKNMYNICLPYDFWCSGTEPFWSLLISEAEGGFFLKAMGDKRGRGFPWAAPVRQGDVWKYRSANQKLSVTIRKEPCSDGMSDREYRYSAELSVDGQTLRGCAVRAGEPLPSRE